MAGGYKKSLKFHRNLGAQVHRAPCVFIDVWSCTYLAADSIPNDLVSRERMFVCSRLVRSTMNDKSGFNRMPFLPPFETSLGRSVVRDDSTWRFAAETRIFTSFARPWCLILCERAFPFFLFFFSVVSVETRFHAKFDRFGSSKK